MSTEAWRAGLENKETGTRAWALRIGRNVEMLTPHEEQSSTWPTEEEAWEATARVLESVAPGTKPLLTPIVRRAGTAPVEQRGSDAP